MSAYLNYPVRQPAADVDGNNGQNERGDTRMRLGKHAGLVTLLHTISSDASQTKHDESVEDRNERDRSGKAEQEAVPDKSHLGGDKTTVWPAENTGVTSAGAGARRRRGVEYRRQHGEHRRHPDARANQSRDAQRPAAQRRHRPTNGQVAIGAHDRQHEHGRKPVDWRGREEQAADDGAEHPAFEDRRRDEEWQTYQKAEVGDGQIGDVEVSNGLRLGVARYDDNNASVADDPADTDQQMSDRYDCFPSVNRRHAIRRPRSGYVIAPTCCVGNVIPQELIHFMVSISSHPLQPHSAIQFAFFFLCLVTVQMNTHYTPVLWNLQYATFLRIKTDYKQQNQVSVFVIDECCKMQWVHEYSFLTTHQHNKARPIHCRFKATKSVQHTNKSSRIHKSAKTHAGNVFWLMTLTYDILTPK